MGESYIIGKGSSDRDALIWVLRAKDKTVSPHGLHLLRVQGGFLIATDGHRLHQYRLLDLKIADGLYRALKDQESFVLVPDKGVREYPSIEEAFPEGEPIYKTKLWGNGGIDAWMEVYSLRLSISLVQLIKALPDGVGVNLEYLADALSFDVAWTISVFPDSQSHRIVLTAHGLEPLLGEFTAVIMPMRI